MTTLKSKLMKLLMLGLLVLTAFAFIACGDKGGDDDDSGSGSGEILTAEESAAKLKAIGDYDIVVDVVSIGDQAMSMEMGKKGNTYWFVLMDGLGFAYKLDGNNCYGYLGTTDESNTMTWMYMGIDSSDAMDDSLQYFDSSLFYAGELPADLKKSGSAKIAGRPCTKYTWSESASAGGNSASAQETIYIDNETGICMKLEASDTVNGVSESGSFEVKKFVTGNAVVAPTLPPPEDD